MTYSDDHEVDNAVLTATNEASLYEDFCFMARGGGSRSLWRAFVKQCVCRLPFVKLDTPVRVNDAAMILRDYYIDHVNAG